MHWTVNTARRPSHRPGRPFVIVPVRANRRYLPSSTSVDLITTVT
jgi:hypothetical protein